MCGAVPALRHPFSRQVACFSTDTSLKLMFLIFKHANSCYLQTDYTASRNTPNCHTGVDCKRDRCFEHVQLFHLIGVLGIPTRLRPRRRRNLGFFPVRDKRISFEGFKPALGLTSASYKCVPAAHSPAVKGLKREAELHSRG